MTYSRTLVVTSCTGKKKNQPGNQLTLADFKSLSCLQSRTKELKDYICDAGLMYTGMQHLRVMEGVKILRSSLKSLVVDVAILSAPISLTNCSITNAESFMKSRVEPD